MRRRIRYRRGIEEVLQSTDLETEMDIHLQPIVDVATGRIVCVEALARWTSNTLGAVPPDVFIPLAERMGLINKLTLILLGKVLKAAERLPAEVRLSFNLSGHGLVSERTVLGIISMVRRSNVDPRSLIFELTETAVVRDLEIAE